MRKVLIFDFDGVLADTRDDILRFAEVACAELGYPCRATLGDLNALEHMSFDNLARRLGVPEERVEAFTKRSFELFNARSQPPAVVAGMPAVVAQLSERHDVGIVTGNNLETVRDFLQHHGLKSYVQAVLAVDAPGTRPEKIERIAAGIGDPGSEIYVIGDAVSDIRAAREASAKSVAATWGHQSGPKLEAAAPDYVVHAPEELLGLFADTSANYTHIVPGRGECAGEAV
jgi:phosphoglycolate phosphatase-like HAD superfamily hydrolase